MQCPLTTLSLDKIIKSTGAWRPCPSYFFNKQRIWKSRGHVPPPSSINKRDRAVEALCVEFFLQASGRVETMAPAISIFSIRDRRVEAMTLPISSFYVRDMSMETIPLSISSLSLRDRRVEVMPLSISSLSKRDRVVEAMCSPSFFKYRRSVSRGHVSLLFLLLA